MVRHGSEFPRDELLISEGISVLYGAAAGWRRRWYARDPARRRRLRRPVISVGNLSVGGTGKTPIVAHIARILADQGERPAILSRGYGRKEAPEGVTVVSDGKAVLAGVDTAGDEPLMLARTLPDVRVLVGTSRYLCGVLAQEKLGVTVHILDDGFQHLELARDVDLLAVTEEDIGGKVLPAGRLREPLGSAKCADALIASVGSEGAAEHLGRALGVPTVFRAARALGVPYLIGPDGAAGKVVTVSSVAPAFAFSAIARPAQFVASLTAAGWRVVGSHAFRDHHLFTRPDVERIVASARASGATMILTTEKDAVRIECHDFGGLPVAAVPLTVTIEDASRFGPWLSGRLEAARSIEAQRGGGLPSTPHVPVRP